MEGMPDDSKSWRCWGKRMKTQYRNQEITEMMEDFFNAIITDWKSYNPKRFHHVTLLMSISPHYCKL